MASTNYVAPGQMRHMRACMVCSIVQQHSVGVSLFVLYVVSRPLNLLPTEIHAGRLPQLRVFS